MQEESFGIIPLKRTPDGWEIFLIQHKQRGHKQGGHWGFPKGKGHPGETALESAVRELFEETGLKVDRLIQEEPFLEKYTYVRKGNKIEKKVLYFPALVSGQPALQPSEISAGKWFSLGEAQKQLTFAESKKSCKLVEQGLVPRFKNS